MTGEPREAFPWAGWGCSQAFGVVILHGKWREAPRGDSDSHGSHCLSQLRVHICLMSAEGLTQHPHLAPNTLQN